MQGTVKWFNSKRGYGFITGEDEKDYFAHFQHIVAEPNTYKTLYHSEKVSFDVGTDDNGREMAVNIQLINKRERKPRVRNTEKTTTE